MTKDIVLSRLTLRNFKGIRDFVLEAGGEHVSVFGDNAVGKTTLFDGFTWLLFDKDSENKEKFDIKTLDKSGKPIHNLEHEVEGILLINGKRKTLRKVLTEKWTRKRGSATAEFTGHETQHYVDSVPVSQSEYKAEVAAIIDEKAFKLLSNPAHFNEVLDKQERRKVLLNICGDISDADVIASNKALAKLPAILGDLTIDKYRAVLTERRKKINEDLEKIPVRIDEVHRSMPDTDGLDEDFLSDDIAVTKTRIEEKEAELSRIRSGGEIAVKETRQREIEGELLQTKNELQSGSLEKVTEKRREVADLRRKAEDTDHEIKSLERNIQRHESAIKDFRADCDRLRAEWSTANESKFVLDHQNDSCPACGQSLPEDQVKAAHEKALTGFNFLKSDRMEGIRAKGKAAKSESDRLEQEKAGFIERIEELAHLRTKQATSLDEAEAELSKLQAGMSDPSADPQYIRKQQELEVVKQEILSLRSSIQGSVEQARIDLAKLRTDLERLEQQKAKLSQAQVAEERIDVLKQQEKELATEFERLEQELYLTEEFIRSKVALLESKINSEFKYARFKLFEQQINGGVKEVCETTYDGVPYSTGLNNAARINVGLDIINTLAEHFETTAPIFIDNAEAVTRLIDTQGQQICLVVSETDKQLRVETAKVKEAV